MLFLPGIWKHTQTCHASNKSVIAWLSCCWWCSSSYNTLYYLMRCWLCSCFSQFIHYVVLWKEKKVTAAYFPIWRKTKQTGTNFRPWGKEGGHLTSLFLHPHCCWAPIMSLSPSLRQGAADIPCRSSPPVVLVPAEALPVMAPGQAEIFSRLASPCLACLHVRGRWDHSPHLSFSFSVVLWDRGVGHIFVGIKIHYISLVYLKFFVLSQRFLQ